MTPCLRALKERWPHLSLAVVVERPFAGVFLGNPCLDEVVVLEKRPNAFATAWHRLALGRALRRSGFDLAVNYHGGSTSRLLMRLSGAPVRAGYGHYRGRRAYTHREDRPERFFGGGPLHTVQFQLALLASLGLPLPEPLPDPEIPVPPEAAERVARRLAGWGTSAGGYIHIHPTATLFTKQWPPEAFAGLVRRLRERFPHVVVLTAGPAEGAVLDAVEAGFGAPCPAPSTWPSPSWPLWPTARRPSSAATAARPTSPPPGKPGSAWSSDPPTRPPGTPGAPSTGWSGGPSPASRAPAIRARSSGSRGASGRSPWTRFSRRFVI